MIFYCDLQGNLKAFQNETVYQGSNNVTTIYVVAPFSRPVGLNISFTKPNKLVTSPAIMKWVGTLGNVKIPVSFVNIPEQFTDTYNVWAYALPYSITEQNGVVGVSVNAVIADSVDASGQQAYKGNLTTFTGQFTVAYSALPSPPTDIPTEWTQDKVLDLLNNYYNDAIQKIGEMNTLKTNAKDTLVKAINEVFDEIASTNATIGNLSTLTTDEKTTIVGAINEVDAHADANKAEIGNLSALTTDEKATLVGAINEVDNHADNATTLANNAVATANSAVATANEAKTTAQTAETNANSAVDTANAANATADEAKAIAQGSQRAIGFATLQAAITALNGYSNTQLKVGDNVYIVETGVPDLWVAAVEQNSVAYNYTTNDAFNDDLVENTLVQVGYYKFAYLESDGKPCTVAWQNMVVAASDWVASTEFEDFAYEAKIILSDFVNFSSIPQVVFGLTEATSGNYAPICKAGDKGVYIYSKVNTSITLPTVVTFAPNVHGASMQGGGYTNKGKWVASTTYAIDDLVYTDNGQFVCIEGITSTTSPEQDATHWQATFVATGKTKNGLTISGQDNGTGVQKTFDGSTAVEIAFDETTMTAKEVNGVLKVGAKGTIPEALPQEASALKSGSLPTSGWSTLDEGWKGSTLPAVSKWSGVTYGGGKYVAVADSSSAGAYSTDGITWTAMSMPGSSKWLSITYGDGKFVAVAFINGAYSTDGINWSSMTLPGNREWQSVTYGDGKFVAVTSSSQNSAYSTDGITWTEMSMPASKSWQSVTYGNGKFVAVADNSSSSAYSTDGINWTAKSMPASRDWRSVTYGNGKFVAVARATNKGAYSTDGIGWTEMTLPASRTWKSITYGNGKFVAVAINSNKGAYSTDGINWTEMSLPASSEWWSVTYGDGKFVAVAENSANGAYWKAAADVTYSISDTSITANSDILMELTDEGGVKAHAIANGSITVIRDAVPTQPIPYTYKVKQTNASGQFTLVNHFVPSIPESPTSLPVTYKKASGSLPTSGWTEVTTPNLIWEGTQSVSAKGAKDIYNSSLSFVPTSEMKADTEPTHWQYKKSDGTWANVQRIYTTDGTYNGLFLITTPDGASFTGYEFLDGADYMRIANGSTASSNFYGIRYVGFTQRTYTISDTSITANTSVKMYLTDAGGVKAQNKANGSITVIRDEVPTTAIPYEYEVEQTSAEGLFEVINAYVPTKTSELTNDSGFVKTSEANTWTGVQTFSNADGIKTDRVHNLDNNDAWYNFDGSNNRFGSPSRPTIIRTSEARPKAEVPSGSATVMKELALLEDVQGDAEWSDIVQDATVSAGLYYVLMDMDEVIQTAGNPSIVFYDGTHWAHGIPHVNCGVVDGVVIIQTFTPHIDPGYNKLTATYAKVTCENGVWTQVKMDEPSKFKYRKIN